jgi:hypothetical protein
MLEYLADLCMIQLWRSFWLACDKFLFKNDPSLSAYVCGATGILVYSIIHFFNRSIKLLFILKKPEIKANGDTFINKKDKIISSSFSVEINNSNKTRMKYLSTRNIIFLNVIFLICFSGTVTSWRSIWILQTIYLYPSLIENKVHNAIFLNTIYMCVCIGILWSMSLVSALLSRANCEDCYFLARKNYIMKQNNFKTFFYRRVYI